jgi:hypothetical protein
VRPEVSIEGRRWKYSTPFTERGRLEGLPSGFGIDTVVGLRTARSEDVLTGPSFLSLAYPKGNWSLAFFRHELANFEFSSETRGLVAGGTNCCQIRFYDERVTTDLEFVSYGLSGGYRAHDRFDVGFGVIYHETSLTSLATQFLPDEDPVLGLLAPTSYLPERLFLSQSLYGDNTGWGLIGGFLWRLSNTWRIGGVFRQGPELDLAGEKTTGPANDLEVPPGTALEQFAGLSVESPWVLGLGFAYKALDDDLTLSFQWDRINYSSIVESADLDARAVDDADELHLGGEYVFLGSTPIIAVRIGAWLDPDHQIRATSDEPFARAVEPRGEDEMHYALGLGMALESFQIDLGVDFSDRVDTLSLSAIYDF